MMHDRAREEVERKDFREVFAEAQSRVDFWEEDAVLSFTDDLCLAMDRAGTSRAELARKLGTSQAYITKVLRGDANFTLRTMARLAFALDSQLRFHLAPRESRTIWFDEFVFQPAGEYELESGTLDTSGLIQSIAEGLDEHWTVAA